MRTTITGITAILLAGIAAPALAETKAGSPAPIAGVETREPMAQDQRYCVQSTLTGSRIARKVCKTRAEWLDEGFDPLAPKK